jgi:tetratricopeptide (TPR) repeat protein
VVIRNEALERCLDGGAANFGAIAPNAMSYADDSLSQASFMSPVDAEEFCKDLELRGLQRNDVDPDFVVVSQNDQSVEPECKWLILFEWEDRLIGTLRGSTSRTVIAPQKSFDNVQHYSADEIAEKFEFVTRKDNVDTYRNKETGELVYSARRTETDDEIFKNAFDTVWQNKREIGHPAKTGDAKKEVLAAIDNLQKVVARNPDSPRAHLALGMAWYSVGKADNGIRSLRKANELDPEELIYLKELSGVLLSESFFEEALEYSRRAVVISPDSPDLLGNLGVTEILNQMPERAAVTLEKALKFEPNDQVNKNLRRIAAEINSGQRPQPNSLQELMKAPAQPKKKSLWARLFGK